MARCEKIEIADEMNSYILPSTNKKQRNRKYINSSFVSYINNIIWHISLSKKRLPISIFRGQNSYRCDVKVYIRYEIAWNALVHFACVIINKSTVISIVHTRRNGFSQDVVKKENIVATSLKSLCM